VLEQPKEEEIQNTADDMLRKVMADVRDRVEECLREGRSHLTNTVFKKMNSKSIFEKCLCVYIVHVEW
jgi:hypothetical protein